MIFLRELIDCVVRKGACWKVDKYFWNGSLLLSLVSFKLRWTSPSRWLRKVKVMPSHNPLMPAGVLLLANHLFSLSHVAGHPEVR